MAYFSCVMPCRWAQFGRWIIPLTLTGMAAWAGGCTTAPPTAPSTAPAEPQPPRLANGRPQLDPRPTAAETWECEVVVVGGSLGGVAAAAHAMQTGATTCLIELTPWLGGQVSSQGVSAIDESLEMRAKQNFSSSWQAFKQRIAQQTVTLPEWTGLGTIPVAQTNACWVGHLCFVPQAGAAAATDLLKAVVPQAPDSQWQTQTAFKGATFDESGRVITAIHAVQRRPKSPSYHPTGRLSQELASWYSWSPDETFEKVPLQLVPPAGQTMVVIDATDTGELVGWAQVPHRLGSEAKTTLGEVNGSARDNPDCTQAFTYPFAIAIHNDQNRSAAKLDTLLQATPPLYAVHEHEKQFALEGFPVFNGRSFFHYRRIVATTQNDPFTTAPATGDITLVNWNKGNDWTWMNPPLILTSTQLEATGQYQNWMGGLSTAALRHGEDHALLFARWLLKTQATERYPLSYLSGADMPLGTTSGLSMTPYIREGRRIVGRAAYGDTDFMMREADLRTDQPGGRDFSSSSIAVTHYDIDIHGCRYRNGEPSWEAGSAPAREFVVRPVNIPIESLVPQGIDNLLIGGKSIAVSHIVNALTRIHTSEWGVGAAAGVIASEWVTQPDAMGDTSPAAVNVLQEQLVEQGLRLTW
ncbi:MAG: FAD-dependent oxidoreductase [Cyanobacteria bacterium J06632_22]